MSKLLCIGWALVCLGFLPAAPLAAQEGADRCEARCREAHEVALRSCKTETGALDEECVARARRQFEACLAECGVDEPPPPPSCATECERRFEAAKSECVREDGTIGPDCLERARAALTHCLAECEGGEPPPPPPPPSCEDACEERYHARLRECTRDNGTVDEECAQAARAGFEACLKECGGEPPPPPPPDDCESSCERRYHAALRECAGPDGAVSEECAAKARGSFELCLGECKGEPPPPPPGCESLCKTAAEAALAACQSARGILAGDHDGEDIDCERRSRMVLEECLMRCDRPDDEPPPSPGCKERCAEASRAAAAKCEAAGIAPEECRARAARLLESCVHGCEDAPPLPCLDRCRAKVQAELEGCVSDAVAETDVAACRERLAELLAACARECEPPPPPPSCEARCREHAGAVLERCVREGGDRDVCLAKSAEALRTCVRGECGDEPPPPPPACEDRCEEHYRKLVSECLHADEGATAEECTAENKPALEACLLRCQDAPPPSCADRCQAAADEILARCLSEAGDSEEGQERCKAAARQSLETCRSHCERPEPPACEDRCAAAAKELRARCQESETPDVCEERVRQVVAECMEGCRPDTRPPTCEERCRAGVQKVLTACLDEGKPEAECKEAAAAFARRCADHCDHGPAPDCGDRCAEIARRIHAECLDGSVGADGALDDTAAGDCREKAAEVLKSCLVRCEEKPAPCGERCAQRARDRYSECLAGMEEAVAACIEAGGDEAECKARAARACREETAGFLARCLAEACPQPEPPPAGCPDRCEAAAEKLLAECEARGGEDVDCVAHVREFLERCETACEDGPRPQPEPEADCDADCDAIAAKLAARCAESDLSAEECRMRAAEFADHCKARLAEACEVREAALVRTPVAFRRGDVNRDLGFDISDAIAALGGLFLGDTAALECADAADMNDDGNIDISDPVYGLMNLFLGGARMPAPESEPGHDPTADALLCAAD